jgi:NAD(P)H-flavin reductase
MPVDVEARVIRNTRLSSDYNVIALAAPDIAAAALPGQFVMVKSRWAVGRRLVGKARPSHAWF